MMMHPPPWLLKYSWTNYPYCHDIHAWVCGPPNLNHGGFSEQGFDSLDLQAMLGSVDLPHTSTWSRSSGLPCPYFFFLSHAPAGWGNSGGITYMAINQLLTSLEHVSVFHILQFCNQTLFLQQSGAHCYMVMSQGIWLDLHMCRMLCSSRWFCEGWHDQQRLFPFNAWCHQLPQARQSTLVL
jgi:hypothetical protein